MTPITSVVFLLLVVTFYDITTADSIMTPFYGGSDNTISTALDQGRINYIEWGWKNSTWAGLNGAIVILSWKSDKQSVSSSTLGTPYNLIPCSTIQLEIDDFIIGYKIYYSSSYVEGLEFYTLRGYNYSCYSIDEIINKQYATNTYFNSSHSFLYLSGFNVSEIYAINGMQLQFTQAIQPLIEILPDSQFSATSYYQNVDTDIFCAPYQARFSSPTAWCWDQRLN